MGIFDKFKSKKSEDKKKAKAQKEENVLDMVREEKPVAESVKTASLKAQAGLAYKFLVRPQITEKATMLSAQGKYVFQIHPDSNKNEIKKAVEKVYDVHVEKVNILVVSGKSRRYGRTLGKTKNWKKAVVTLRKGEHIAGITATEQA